MLTRCLACLRVAAKFQVNAKVFTQKEEPAACIDLWSASFLSRLTAARRKLTLAGPVNFLVPDQH
jgi:hypothetical protein